MAGESSSLMIFSSLSTNISLFSLNSINLSMIFSANISSVDKSFTK